MGLTVKMVAKLLSSGQPGRYFDSKGLYLVIGGKNAASWERRYRLHEREHYYGLGSAIGTFGLAAARKRNEEISRLLADRIDPLEQKRAQRAQQAALAARTMTFGECAEEFFKTNSPTWKHRAHLAQWSSTVLGRTLRGKPVEYDYCKSLRHLPVQAIDTPIVMSVLRPHWHEKSETMSRIRARIASVLDWAKAAGYRTGDNAAAWQVIGKLLPSPSKVAKVEHLEAVPYTELPAFMRLLRQRRGSAARALEFTIMTCARTDETLAATFSEFDFDEKVWTVPAERMKGEREHKVPLAPQVIELLKELPREGDVVFVGPTQGKGLNDAAMLDVMKRMKRTETVHGFRSSFSDWAHEQTAYDNHSIEISLAHAVGAEAEKAYRRGPMLAKRRRLMEDWARYCMTLPVMGEERSDKIVAIRPSTALVG